MAVGETEVINTALVMLGNEPVLNRTDNNKRAKLADAIFDDTRDKTLEQHVWNFATTRAQLQKASNPPAFGFSSAFVLPADFIRFVRLDDFRQLGRIEEHDVNGDGNTIRTCVLTDDDSVNILYVNQVTDLARWTPNARDMLSFKLAERLALPLTQSLQRAQTMAQAAQNATDEARFIDSLQSPHQDQMNSYQWEDARDGRGGFTDQTLINTGR